jgi:Holliday junction resolvase
MPNKRYIKGRNHENYIKRKYENLDFACIRSSGSKGPVDVIAIKKGPYCSQIGGHCPLIHAIQCKSNGNNIRKTDKEKIQSWMEKAGIEVTIE